MRDLSKSQKEAVVQGSRLMHLLSSWSGYRMTDTKSAPEPYVRVKLKVLPAVQFLLLFKLGSLRIFLSKST